MAREIILRAGIQSKRVAPGSVERRVVAPFFEDSCSNPVDPGGRNLTQNVWRDLEMSSKPSKTVSVDERA
jgi:hypothetical protein